MRLASALVLALLFISAPSLGCPASEKEGMTASTDVAPQSVEVADRAKREAAKRDRSSTPEPAPTRDSSRNDG